MSATPESSQPPAKLGDGQRLENIFTKDVRIKPSSGTTKDAKALLDGSNETCWTSASTSPLSFATPSFLASGPHTLTLDLPEPVEVGSLHSLVFTFQGGFTPLRGSLAADVGATHEAGTATSLEGVAAGPRHDGVNNTLSTTEGAAPHSPAGTGTEAVTAPTADAAGQGESAEASNESSTRSWERIVAFFPSDNNAKQYYKVRPVFAPEPGSADWDKRTTSKLQIELQGSSDSFGRVTIYSLELYAVRG